MKKTALETLIDWITDEVHPDQIKEQAELLLETEKQQIINAFGAGNINGQIGLNRNSEQYFNNTFKNK